jgi:hypothetical protein
MTSTTVWGVDTASGVESSPGIKDRELVKRFVHNATTAFEQQGVVSESRVHGRTRRHGPLR